MKTIVFTAQAFGFGPVSKMLAISESVREVRKIFFGTDVSYDLAKLHPFDEIYQFSSGDQEEVINLLQKADLFINVMDFSLNHLAQIAGCPYFLIDSLLWFWPELQEGVREADIYFCQDFLGSVKAKIQEYSLTNAQMIGPIINENFCRFKYKDQVIVNFGGMECSFIEIGKNSNYPFVILKNLLPILKNEFSCILVTGRERVMKMCREKFPQTDFLQFKMLDQRSMLEELYSSRAIFTVPGIQSFYDAADKVPIFCLPPQSSSNFKNLNLLISHNAIKFYLQWSELYPLNIDKYNKGDAKEIPLVLEKIKVFENSEDDQSYFRSKVKCFLENRSEWQNLISMQKKLLKTLGPNGAKSIADKVTELLCKAISYS